MDPYDDDLERGLRNRRAILGDAWVDRAADSANAFGADFQNFITRYAWHEVWGRPGLAAATRRIVVLAITCALGRWEEFELHLRAALVGGSGASLGAGDDADTRLTPDQVKELLMQVAVYAGVPVANTGMAIATRLLHELGHELPALAMSAVAHPGVGRSFRSAGMPALHCTVREPAVQVGGPPTRPHTIVLSHALGCDSSLWDALANALAAGHPASGAAPCRVICFDHRGHGDSDAPAGPYTLAELADDAERLLAEAAADTAVVWVGISLGGMVGQELALRYPQRVKALVIANSSSGYDATARAAWQERIATVERLGLEAVADGAMQRWFSQEFHARQPATVARWRRRLLSTPLAGYLGCCHAICGLDTGPRLGRIGVPTLVIAGSLDQGTPLAMSRAIADAVPGARLEVLEGAAHLSVIEQPQAFESAVRSLLADASRVENTSLAATCKP